MPRCRTGNRPCRRTHAQPSPYRCLYRSIFCFSFVLVLGLIGFTVGVVSYFSPPIQNTITAQAMDTRIVSVSLVECGELEVRNKSDLVEVELFILLNKPVTQPGAVFSESHDFFQRTNTQPDEFAYNYYLLEGSSVHFSFYLEQYITYHVSVLVYVFNQQVIDRCSQDEAVGYYICDFSYPNTTCDLSDISIPSEDEYYFSLCFRSDEDQGPQFVSGRSTAHVNKLMYKPGEENIRSVCTAPCSEEILHYNDYIMMKTSNVTENVTWETRVDFYWQCSDIREVGIWVSFVMLLSMFFIMLSIGFIVALCVVLCIRKRTEDDENELLIPSDENSPVLTSSVPPPQYTVASENSLRSPPPYTELPEPHSGQDK